MDFYAVPNAPEQIHIVEKTSGYYFQYFRYLRPIVNKILEASPYELVSSGGYKQLIGTNQDTWIYRHESSTE